jgi:conjugative transposon TraN protein
MGRGNRVAAFQAMAEFVKETCSMIHLLNHAYCPFYKWMWRSTKEQPVLGAGTAAALEALTADPYAAGAKDMIEEICIVVKKELQRQGLTDIDEDFLEQQNKMLLREHSLGMPPFNTEEETRAMMVIRLNNIYTVGDYFFLDFSIENRTNIKFDIDEMRFKLADKKQSKATNSQVIELTPAMTLENATSFKYGYRNVVVLKKMTFPNDKVLTIELSEKQISGRTLSLNIDYEDVLSADSFNHLMLKEE